MNSDQIVSLADKIVTGLGFAAVSFGLTDTATIGPYETAAFAVIGGAAVLYGGIRSILTHTHAAQIAKGQQSQVTVDVANATSP